MVENESAKDKEMDASISVKLPSDLRDKAREKSEKTGVSLSFIVRKALEDWINEENKKH